MKILEWLSKPIKFENPTAKIGRTLKRELCMRVDDEGTEEFSARLMNQVASSTENKTVESILEENGIKTFIDQTEQAIQEAANNGKFSLHEVLDFNKPYNKENEHIYIMCTKVVKKYFESLGFHVKDDLHMIVSGCYKGRNSVEFNFSWG